ncbi:MAG: sigma factor-like helix-turn-helix DNA-binding protein [Aquihabitans sp.]
MIDNDDAAADGVRRWEMVAALAREEQPAMVRLAALMLGDRARAEEVVQEAFVRLYPVIERTERPGAYLRTTVVNLCHGEGRRRATALRHPAPEPTSTLPPGLPPDLSEVWLALDTLPERQRSALVLRFYLDLPDDQIADLLEARPGTVRSLISRGLTTLEKVLTS